LYQKRDHLDYGSGRISRHEYEGTGTQTASTGLGYHSRRKILKKQIITDYKIYLEFSQKGEDVDYIEQHGKTKFSQWKQGVELGLAEGQFLM
jgi:hypothetical protein